MDRSSFLGGLQLRQAFEERLERGRLITRQYRERGLFGAGGIAGHRENERARAPCRDVLLAQQRIEHRERTGPIARHRQRERHPARGLGIGTNAQQHRIILLRLAVVAAQIIGQPAIERDVDRRDTQVGRVVEQLERRARLLLLDKRRTQPGLDPAVARGDLLGPDVEVDRGVGIADRECRRTRARQRLEVARIARQHA